MGIHYVHSSFVSDGAIEAYEPIGNERRLVGVEYIVDAATWLSQHNNVPPSLECQDFQFVGAPNRFALPAFFELHQGAFVDWNNHVTCEGQRAKSAPARSSFGLGAILMFATQATESMELEERELRVERSPELD